MQFVTAAEVRSFLKEKGFAKKVQIKRTYSMFSGNLLFSVYLPEYKGIHSVSSFGSREPLRFGTLTPDDPTSMEKATVLNQLCDLLAHTNASPTGQSPGK